MFVVDASAPILESTIAAVYAGAGLVVLVDPTANDQRCRQPDNAAASNVAAQSAAGHDSAEILQTVLAEACIELVAMQYRERARIGIKQENIVGVDSHTYNVDDIQPHTLTALRQLRAVAPITSDLQRL